MKKFILHIALLSLTIYFLLPRVIDGVIIDGSRAGIIAVILFAFINLTIRPIIHIVSIPFNFLTLGLFGIGVNILLFWFVASILDGIIVTSFTAAALGALILIVANWIIERIVK